MALGLGEQGAGDGLETMDAFLAAECLDQRGLLGGFVIGPIGQEGLALEPQGLESCFESFVIETAAAIPFRPDRVLGGDRSGGRTVGGTRTQPDDTVVLGRNDRSEEEESDREADEDPVNRQVVAVFSTAPRTAYGAGRAGCRGVPLRHSSDYPGT